MAQIPNRTAKAAKDELEPQFQSRAEVAAKWLRNAIMRGDFKPGERLLELNIARQLGIGQPTVREALKELEHLGFVRKTPKRGTHVTKLSRDDFLKILEVRMALEGVVVERAATRLTDEHLGQIEQLVETMNAAAKERDLATFHQCDVDFHQLIAEAAGNEYLALALERVAFGLFAFVLLQWDGIDASEFRAAGRQHQEILEGLKTRNPKLAREAFVAGTLRFWRENHGLDIVAQTYTSNGNSQ